MLMPEHRACRPQSATGNRRACAGVACVRWSTVSAQLAPPATLTASCVRQDRELAIYVSDQDETALKKVSLENATFQLSEGDDGRRRVLAVEFTSKKCVRGACSVRSVARTCTAAPAPAPGSGEL